MSRIAAPRSPLPVESDRRTDAAPWVDTTLPASRHADRLSFDQPPAGLLWVISGEVQLELGGRERPVGKGDVVAYRLGKGLRWSASEGTHARWSARDVRLRLGGAQPWTQANATDLPAVRTGRRRRNRALIAVALSGASALGVSALVSHLRTTGSAPPALSSEPWKKLAPARPTPPEVRSAFRLAGERGMEPNDCKLMVPAQGDPDYGRGSQLYVPVRALFGSDEEAIDAFEEYAHAILGENPSLGRVRVVLLEKPGPDDDSRPPVEVRVGPGRREPLVRGSRRHRPPGGRLALTKARTTSAGPPPRGGEPAGAGAQA